MGAPGCPTPAKKGYKDQAAAKRHAWGLLKKKPADKRSWRRLDAYRCPCGLWHVGHGRRVV